MFHVDIQILQENVLQSSVNGSRMMAYFWTSKTLSSNLETIDSTELAVAMQGSL